MGGKGSGRKGYGEEKQIEEIIKLSNRTILHYLRDPQYPLADKVRIAQEFSKRRVSEKRQIDAHIITAEEQAVIDRYARQPVLERLAPTINGTENN